MAHFPDSSPFSDGDRGADGERTPFPRWKRRLAEAEGLLSWAPADDERRPESDPDH